MARNVANSDDAKPKTHYLSALRYNREFMQSPDTCPYCPCYYYRKPWEEGSGGLHGQWHWGHQWQCLDQEVQSQLTHSLPFARTQLGPPLQLGAGGRFDWFQSGVCGTQYGFRLRASLPLPLVTEEPSISHLAVLQAGHPACCRWVRDGLSWLFEHPWTGHHHFRSWCLFLGLSVGVGLLTSFLYVNKNIQTQVFLQVCQKYQKHNIWFLFLSLV